MNKPYLNLTGQTIGTWTVIEEVKPYIYNRKDRKRITRRWKCQCICGKTKTITQDKLRRNNNIYTCISCLFTKDLKDKKFNQLLVLEKTNKKNKKGRIIWKCQCDCGKICMVDSTSLSSGNTKSCGCLKLERIKNLNLNNKGELSASWKGYEEINGVFFSGLKNTAKRRKIHFDINIKQIYDLYIQQNKKCAISNIDLIIRCYSPNNYQVGNASLDRIDSSKGYTIDNIQWVDKNINIAKHHLSQNNFIQLCLDVSSFQENKVILSPLKINDNLAGRTGYKGISGWFWSSFKSNATKRKKTFDITINEAWDLFVKQQGRCKLSGREINLSGTNRNNTASIDRIDNHQGYISGNIQWLHTDVNFAKYTMSDKEFIQMCKNVVDHQKQLGNI